MYAMKRTKISELSSYIKSILKGNTERIALDNLHIVSYWRTGGALYFTVIQPDSPKSPLKLWIHGDIMKSFNGISPLLYLNTNVYVEGILTVDFHNNIEIDVSKIVTAPKPRYLPLYCYKIAVISNFSYKDNKHSMGAGLEDFLVSLKYGQVTKFNAMVSKPEQIAMQIYKINEIGSFDCICIIRGGGKDDELSNFEKSVELTKAIKESKLPIILGIGHSKNTFDFAQYVAQECINPTAAAYFINERFETLRADIEKKLLISEQYIGESISEASTKAT